MTDDDSQVDAEDEYHHDNRYWMGLDEILHRSTDGMLNTISVSNPCVDRDHACCGEEDAADQQR